MALALWLYGSFFLTNSCFFLALLISKGTKDSSWLSNWINNLEFGQVAGSLGLFHYAGTMAEISL